MSNEISYNLQRFKDAHKESFPIALSEMRRGKKQSHWMWYIFPQIAGLGRSAMSMRYAIQDIEEARLYLTDKILREHMLEICGVLLALPCDNATAIMGVPDDMKLRSSMTLFAEAAPHINIFQEVLNKYFDGKKDERTMSKL